MTEREPFKDKYVLVESIRDLLLDLTPMNKIKSSEDFINHLASGEENAEERDRRIINSRHNVDILIKQLFEIDPTGAHDIVVNLIETHKEKIASGYRNHILKTLNTDQYTK